MPRIALWNTAFLGDAVLTLPLAQSLRFAFPDAEIDLYVRKGVEELFAPHPALNTVYPVDKKNGNSPAILLQTMRNIAACEYDVWISAHTSFRSGLFAASSRAPRRVGYSTSPANRLFYTDVVDRRFDELDEIERLFQLLLPLGKEPVSQWPELFLPIKEEEHAYFFFSRLDAPTLGLHPGSVWPTKRWPAAYFADIGVKAAMGGAHVLLFAGPGEESIAAQVLDLILKELPRDRHGLVYDLAGKLSLTMLAAYLKRLSCYVTNDSGPMHLAWAQHTPVTALFGPTVRKLGFFPRGKSSTVFETELTCRPCGLHGPKTCPKGHHHCMVQLLPETVWPDVETKLFKC